VPVFFLHCSRCNVTVRSIASAVGDACELAADPTIRAFHGHHAGCRTARYLPTGRSEASLPWHEPLAERRIEVSGDDGPALAIGTRTSIDEPLEWRLEHVTIDEQISVELDRDAFFRVLDRALYPHHLSTRTVAALASRIEEFIHGVSLEDLVVLHDDASRANVSHACLTLTSRVALEAALARHAVDAESFGRLRSTFEDPEFPPLAVTRRLVRQQAAA
jgi:hypothetical protein